MTHLFFVFVALAALCGQAAAQTSPATWAKCDFACRLDVIAEVGEREGCGQSLKGGFTSEKAKATILRVATRVALEKRISELCKKDLDEADVVAADLELDPRPAQLGAVQLQPPPPPTGYGQPSTRLAGGLREGPWERVPAPSRAGSGPRCPGQMKFDPALKKCKSEFRDIPLSPQNQAALSNCPTQIMVRHVWKGNRYVQQQRCKW